MKTKLGISAGLLGAAVFFLALVGGWIPTILVAGYILLFEANDWLKNCAVKAVAVITFFALVSAVVGFVPNIITLIDDVANLFNETFSIAFISKIVTLINTVLTIAEKLLLLAMGFKALHHGTVGFGIIDKLIARHTPRD